MKAMEPAAPRLSGTRHPLLYEVNARVLVNELSLAARKRITLATIPDAVLDEWAELGFDAIWLMGVWSTGKIGLQIARDYPVLQDEYKKVLPDFTLDDVIGSPYAVKAYTVSAVLGGNRDLLALRKKLERRGLGLVLDFIGNHTARDHEWIRRCPDFYIHGAPGDELSHPDSYFKSRTVKGDHVIAFGRDPTFPGWTDTAQLNHAHAGMREKLIETLKKVAGLCDGVRCDMAMLMLTSVFERTWGERARPAGITAVEGEFWKEAIEQTRSQHQRFLFIAEAYWDLEWELQKLGFDYTYDKRLYDRILREGASAVYDHLCAEMSFQQRTVRFIENHDELRASHSLSSPAWHCAAATVISTVPGMVLLHEGQLEGRSIRIPVQLSRRPFEPPTPQIQEFYKKLLAALKSEVFRGGTWRLLGVQPAWPDNSTWRNFLAFWWEGGVHGIRLVVVNYAPHSGQCYVPMPLSDANPGTLEFKDLLGNHAYYREKTLLRAKGIFFDLPSYKFHLFAVRPAR